MAAVGFAVLALGVVRSVKADSESISSFNSVIAVGSNGTLDVTETIAYDFGSNEKHGIYRDVPLVSPNGSRIGIQMTGVGNGSGGTYPYSDSVSGNALDVRIGDPNVLVSGLKTYVIRYVVQNAVREFSDHDEVYWNVTGNGWSVPVESVTASMTLPQNIGGLTMACYTGPAGSTAKDCSWSETGNAVTYVTNKALSPGEGLSVVLGIPLGYITVPPQSAAAANAVSGNYSRSAAGDFSVIPIVFIFFIILLVVGVRIISWRSRGSFSGVSLRTRSRPIIPKELKGQPVVVEYGPPDDLLPIEIGTIIDRKVDMADVSSIIMDLAVKGYLKIRYTVKQMRFWSDRKDFELVKLKDGSDLVHPAYQMIFNLLFTARESVSLSDLQGSGATLFETLKRIGRKTSENIYDENYFDAAARDAAGKSRVYFGLGVLVLFMIFAAGMLFGGGFGFGFFMVFVAVALLIIELGRPLSPKLTPKGVTVVQKTLGFREFLQYTEKDKLEMMNAPALKPETFEKFLPYAMVLGVEDKWAKKFEGIYTTMPTWYEDPTMTAFNGSLLVTNLMIFNGSFNKAFNIAAAPATSGFGGGGFSGGGFGGGGGGSW